MLKTNRMQKRHPLTRKLGLAHTAYEDLLNGDGATVPDNKTYTWRFTFLGNSFASGASWTTTAEVSDDGGESFTMIDLPNNGTHSITRTVTGNIPVGKNYIYIDNLTGTTAHFDNISFTAIEPLGTMISIR